jgi:hypothetical protein
MKLLDEIKRIWEVMDKFDKVIYGNGKNGLKTDVNNLITIQKHKKRNMGIFLGLISIILAFGVWALDSRIEQVVKEENKGIINQIVLLEKQLVNRNEISPELIENLTKKIDELIKSVDEPVDVILDFYE